MAVGRAGNNREANAIMAYTLIDFEFRRNWTFNGKRYVGAILFNLADRSQGFNDTSKHTIWF
jgi:hypothetical protein